MTAGAGGMLLVLYMRIPEIEQQAGVAGLRMPKR